MTRPFPPLNLDPTATPWGKEAQRRILDLEANLARFEKSSGNSGRASTSTMSTLSSQVAVLQAVANVQYNEWSSSSGATQGSSGWLGAPTSVRITSPTGRLEVGFGGSMNSGNGIFAYSITGDSSGTIVNRDTVRGNYAQRVAVSGGASFIGSAFNTVIVSVPANEALTVRCEMFSNEGSAYFYGARILARVAP